ncbi:hypothetical protein [Clostridium estertheticum]|uniref:hypothetical protein n=1 Tax=Clostridium estertheticum TaxID=238834 RepID=UPI001C7D0260|nr:hypothetical protein [Clostridium estertheticum]MBX4267552.1 hypothetical protein [Clostridium estertheticum]WLC88634.1 hypothetical protein KTC95_22035 [Clostridium estertheticum]
MFTYPGFFYTNPETNKSPSGKYKLEITVQIVSVQSDEIKIQLGEKSRNLTGKYVHYDEIFGNTVRFEEIINVE